MCRRRVDRTGRCTSHAAAVKLAAQLLTIYNFKQYLIICSPWIKHVRDFNEDIYRTIPNTGLFFYNTGCLQIIGGFCKNHISTNTEHKYMMLYHLKEECLQFHSDLKRIRCAPHVWHGRCPGDTPIPAKSSQATSCVAFQIAVLMLSLQFW